MPKSRYVLFLIQPEYFHLKFSIQNAVVLKVYEQRLAELKKLGDPIVERYREAEARKVN